MTDIARQCEMGHSSKYHAYHNFWMSSDLSWQWHAVSQRWEHFQLRSPREFNITASLQTYHKSIVSTFQMAKYTWMWSDLGHFHYQSAHKKSTSGASGIRLAMVITYEKFQCDVANVSYHVSYHAKTLKSPYNCCNGTPKVAIWCYTFSERRDFLLPKNI